MGYESKLIIVHKSDMSRHVDSVDKDMVWGEVIATYDLCKVYDIDFRKYPATDCFFYDEEDGDEDGRVIEDAYGDTLKELTIEEAIKEIAVANAKGHYRRYAPILAMLTAFNLDEWGNNLRVLHYGH